MNAETLFSICNSVAVIGWLLLAFLPRWRWTSRLVISGAVPLFFASIYLILIATTFGKAEGGFGSLEKVGQLFRNDWVLLAGWVHYLAFDLLVGVWEINDSQRLKLSHWLVVPCLFLTFMFGPLGFLVYHLVSLNARKKEMK